MSLSGKIILLIGGTGSFGKKFAKIVLQKYKPQAIRIFSRGELKQQEMRQEFNDSRVLRFLIGDVRDRNRLYRAMKKVDIVIHAAALKQVSACEYNPAEAVKTNIEGAMNVIDAAVDSGVSKVMALSTDKAVYPVNLYGATKLVAEKLFIQANLYTPRKKTKMGCVRYGNVMDSRGSVVPIFKGQTKEGILTITDKRMTRFWITQEQAVEFIIDCIERMQGGEIFVPKIPSIRITDLANVIAPQIKRNITGIRPGEKLDEVLLVAEEARHSLEFEDFFVIKPEYPFWKDENLKGGKSLPDGFEYSSKNNEWWLTQSDLRGLLEDLN